MTESFDIEAFAHRNPIPAAARVGPMVWSSLVPPFDAGTSEVAESLADQARTVFTNMEAILSAAGIDWSCVGKIDVWLRDPTDRSGLNDAWLERFPDETSRPARQVHDGSTTIPPGDAKLVATFVAFDSARR